MSSPATLPSTDETRHALALRRLGDSELMDRMRNAVAEKRRWETDVARYSAEIARRSAPGLGHDGLAQRTGARTATDLVQRITGDSRAGARATVMVGEVLTGETPWLAAVAEAVGRGQVSIDAASAIRSGLGDPDGGVGEDELAGAAAELVVGAGSTAPEALARDARAARAVLDESGVIDRERALRDRRFLRLIRQDDGMTRLTGLLDPESAALVSDVVDQITSPRRGGPRFVDPARRDGARMLVEDERSTEQIVCDALVDLVRIGASADPGRLYTPRSPEVRVHVSRERLERGRGHATLEDSGAIVSVATADRRACVAGVEPVIFGPAGRILDLGRRERLFTPAQKRALAAQSVRDGTRGCAAPGCDRPPSWCESHHIVPWSRGGRTDVANGVLLCRHHHLLAHDRAWLITRDRDGRPRVEIPSQDRMPT